MHIGRACLWHKITREMRGLASLAPLFALALLLAWLMSAGTTLAFSQSPTSPPPITEVPPTFTPTAPPTEVLVATRIPQPTKMILMPVVQSGPEATPHTESPSAEGGTPLWPWALVGSLSVGAIALGAFLLLRRGELAQTEED